MSNGVYSHQPNLAPRHVNKGRGRGNESMSGRGGYRGGPTHHTAMPLNPNVHSQSLLSLPMAPGNVRTNPMQQIGMPPPQPQPIPTQAGGRQVLIPTPTPPPHSQPLLFPQHVPSTGQVGMRPPVGYPHMAVPGLPPHMPQQMLFQQMQNYQLQQPGQNFGAAPPQQINLQLQQPTLQMPPPTQPSYTRKTGRGKNAIRIINPETGAEVKVDAGSNESPQPSRPLLTTAPAMMTSPVTAPGGEGSTPRSGPSEEFKRKVAQAASDTRPPPPPNAIIRNPNDSRQQPTKEEERKKEVSPSSQISVPQGREEKDIVGTESKQIVESTHPLPVKPTVEKSSSVLSQQQLTKATSDTPTGVATVPASAPPTAVATLVDSGITDRNIVSQEKTQAPPPVGTVAPSDGSTPLEAKDKNIQQKTAEEQEVKKTNLVEASQVVSAVGPKMIESATGEKLTATHEVETEIPAQLETKAPVPPVEQETKRPVSPAQQDPKRLEPSVQQEIPSSTPVAEEPSPPHSQIVPEPSNLPESLSKSQSTDFESSSPSSQNAEENTAPLGLDSAPEIPPATENKHGSEPVSSTPVAETPDKDEGPTESTESVLQSKQAQDLRKREDDQKLESQPEAVVTPEPLGEETVKNIESQTSAPPVFEPLRTKDELQLAPSSEREKGGDAVGAVNIEPKQQDQQEQEKQSVVRDSDVTVPTEVRKTEVAAPSEIQKKDVTVPTEVRGTGVAVPSEMQGTVVAELTEVRGTDDVVSSEVVTGMRRRDEKTGESLAAVSEKEPQKAEKPVQPPKPEKTIPKPAAEETKTNPPVEVSPPLQHSKPSHPERTTYNRDFLLQFKDKCKDAPPQLVNTECFRSSNSVPFVDTFMPPFGGGGGGGGGGRKGRRAEPKRIAHQPREEKVELNKAEKPWARPMERQDNESEESLKTTELYRKFQGILNKLTPQKFKALAEQALLLEINTEERLRGVIDKIFTKALEEPSFSIAYANLCKVLSPVKVEWTLPDGTQKSTNFRRVLLTKCQQEFEKDKKDDEDRDLMLKAIEDAAEEEKQKLREELSERETKTRRRSLGNIRFIGELFKLKMLSEAIMHECVFRLLRSHSDVESLECFARLITTTGKDLDHPQAKQRIDQYFNRIAEIIKKGKVPARIRFMLQDVQDLRTNNWVQRSRQESSLKTIDQIHAEARAEEAVQKQLMQQHQQGMMGSLKQGGRGDGGDKRGRGRDRDGKPDEWSKVEREREKRERERERERDKPKIDTNRINRLKRGDKSKEPTLGPPTSSFRPAWGKGASTATTSAVQDTSVKTDKEREKDAGKHAKPSRSSSSGQKRTEREREREREKGPGTRGTPNVLKRLHSQPDSQKEQQAAIKALKEMTGKPTQKPNTTVQPDGDALKPATPVQPVADALDEDTICRKAGTIVDELTQNRDFKEALECVKEMKSPGMMNVFVRESVNHSLEKSTPARVHVGKLFGELARGQLLTEEKFIAGLNEVLEYAEDMEIDIPKIWDYLGEILAAAFFQPPLPFHVLTSVCPPLVKAGKAAELAAKVLLQVKLQQSEAAALSLWTQSQLEWTSLGVKSEDVEEFISRQKLEFLQSGSSVPTPPPYLTDLSRLFGSSDVTNDDIFDWIEKNCLEKASQSPPPSFVRTLTAAVVQSTVTDSGSAAVFNDDCFKRRLVVLKKYVDESHDLQVEVLYALQISVAKLEHPPKLLNQMFNLVYDVDVVSEQSFYSWRDKGTERLGKGNAVISVKTFFDWLESAETESDGEGGEGGETR